MRRAVAGVVFAVIVATTPLWMARTAEQARAESVTWARDLDAAVARASANGRPLALLFR